MVDGSDGNPQAARRLVQHLMTKGETFTYLDEGKWKHNQRQVRDMHSHMAKWLESFGVHRPQFVSDVLATMMRMGQGTTLKFWPVQNTSVNITVETADASKSTRLAYVYHEEPEWFFVTTRMACAVFSGKLEQRPL